MLPNFASQNIAIAVDNSDLFVRTGGSGPPLLLLHGYPQTGAMWHAVAPKLAERFSLVIPDLPGYGRSTGPACDPDFRAYSKRKTAQTMVALMQALGHDRFHLAGHDRGARVAFRLCLDHGERVQKYAALDIIPTLDQWDGLNADKALGGYHWQFLAVPAPVPERLIGSDPDFYLEHLLRRQTPRVWLAVICFVDQLIDVDLRVLSQQLLRSLRISLRESLLRHHESQRP